MMRNLESVVKEQMGEQTLNVCKLVAQLEALNEQLKQYQAKFGPLDETSEAATVKPKLGK